MDGDDRSAAVEADPQRAIDSVPGRSAVAVLTRSTDVTSAGATGPATTPRTRVLIVDDHLALVEGLAFVIDTRPDLECVGSAGTLAGGIDLAHRLAPDIVLLDVRLPDGDGVDAIARFFEASPGARVLILTGHPDLDVLTRAASAGASGFLQKDSSVEGIVRAIRSARDGDILVEQTTLASILIRVRSGTAARSNGMDAVHFTLRELDVLALMGEGLDPHAIARMLEISLNTCRGYEKSIMAKLDAHSQLEAVVLATRRGLLKSVAT